MPNQSIIHSLYQIGSIQLGEFKLKSGKTSTVYINLRKIISYPAILRCIGDKMWEAVKEQEFDLICGVPYTALPIATYLSLQHNVPMVMRRKEKKEHGTKQLVEGDFKPGQRCLIIEDVVTSGSSILETIRDLENEGIKVTELIALIDRKQGGKENLQNYNLRTIFSLPDVLTHLIDSNLLKSEECALINQFLLENYK